LIIEPDGGQHAEVAARVYDAERTAWLTHEGFRVVRFWNHELLGDRDAVEELIWQRLQELAASPAVQPLTPDPSPTRGEGR
jgi:adenine-specific DNA-methyltransferase